MNTGIEIKEDKRTDSLVMAIQISNCPSGENARNSGGWVRKSGYSKSCNILKMVESGHLGPYNLSRVVEPGHLRSYNISRVVESRTSMPPSEQAAMCRPHGDQTA